MDTDKSQWNEFKLRVNIDTTLPDAYQRWVTPGGLESWFLRKAVFRDASGNIRDKNTGVEAGDTYEWYWHGYPDSVVEKGKVLYANGKDLFKFTFSLECPLTISLYEESGELIVELVETDLPTDNEIGPKRLVDDFRGWIFYLTNLKSVLEGGLNLRNKKLDITNVITA